MINTQTFCLEVRLTKNILKERVYTGIDSPEADFMEVRKSAKTGFLQFGENG